MSRHREAPDNFICPWRDRCPELGQHSTTWIFAEYQRSIAREHEHFRIREEMRVELRDLEILVAQQAAEIDRLTAENKHLHQSRFKPRTAKKTTPAIRGKGKNPTQPSSSRTPRKRGAPIGHAPSGHDRFPITSTGLWKSQHPAFAPIAKRQPIKANPAARPISRKTSSCALAPS